ncbi:hypothetical protein [Limnohabitans sp.]|uniref:hypothetical protein n=1 Tax=Limnohabitans sp. TaxID=1907725 RepID=UPI002AFFEF57|nr:hypothetical protein [Limnohabitans sp.]
MIKKIKPTFFMFIAIITVFVIGCTFFWGSQPGQVVVSTPRATDLDVAAGQDQNLGRDPFKEALIKQQQNGAAQALPSPNSQPVQIVHGNVTATVKPGADPFKAFLELQSKTKSEDAAISPFGK